MAYYNNYPQYPYAYPQSYSSNIESMKWVEGEVGAKAFQMPPGWPAETPIALWDNSEKKIYLKSWNAMGMPNQIQELIYEIKEKPAPALPGNVSGSTQSTQYVTREDFDQLKEEIQNLSKAMQTRGGTK